MPGMTEICVFLAWIAGGFVSGVSGIGGAMVAFPFLACSCRCMRSSP